MRKYITYVILLSILLSACSTNQTTNENQHSSITFESSAISNTITDTRPPSVFGDKINNDCISFFGGSDPILPENKYKAVKKWLNSVDTDTEVLWFMFLSPNNKDIYLLSNADTSPQFTYWIYYVDTDTLIKENWDDGRLFSEQAAQSDKNLEDYVHKGVIAPYLENGNLRDSIKAELDSFFEEKPRSGDFGVIRAYDDYFVVFGNLRSTDNPSKYVLIYYSWDFQLLGTEIKIGNDYHDILNDLRKQ